MNRKIVIFSFLAAALAVSGVVSYWACKSPDGLDSAIEQHQVASAAANSTAPAGPLAEYKVPGVANEFLSNGLAGIVGALLVLGVVAGTGYLLTRGRRRAIA